MTYHRPAKMPASPEPPRLHSVPCPARLLTAPHPVRPWLIHDLIINKKIVIATRRTVMHKRSGSRPERRRRERVARWNKKRGEIRRRRDGRNGRSMRKGCTRPAISSPALINMRMQIFILESILIGFVFLSFQSCVHIITTAIFLANSDLT